MHSDDDEHADAPARSGLTLMTGFATQAPYSGTWSSTMTRTICSGPRCALITSSCAGIGRRVSTGSQPGGRCCCAGLAVRAARQSDWPASHVGFGLAPGEEELVTENHAAAAAG